MLMTGVGRLVAKPVLRDVGETQVVEFTLVDNERRKVNGELVKTSHFFDCVAWDTGARTLAQYCEKGDELYIEASPRQDKWVDKETGKNRSKVIFRVNRFQLLNNRKRDEDVESNTSQSSNEVSNSTVSDDVHNDDVLF